jgi:hypothetical protein
MVDERGPTMHVGLRLSGHEPDRSTELCSSENFDKLLAWMQSLPPGEYPAADAFAKDGKYRGTDVLMRQVNDAALKHAPADDGTGATVETFLDRLGGGYSGETAAVEL